MSSSIEFSKKFRLSNVFAISLVYSLFEMPYAQSPYTSWYIAENFLLYERAVLQILFSSNGAQKKQHEQVWWTCVPISSSSTFDIFLKCPV